MFVSYILFAYRSVPCKIAAKGRQLKNTVKLHLVKIYIYIYFRTLLTLQTVIEMTNPPLKQKSRDFDQNCKKKKHTVWPAFKQKCDWLTKKQ